MASNKRSRREGSYIQFVTAWIKATYDPERLQRRFHCTIFFRDLVNGNDYSHFHSPIRDITPP